MIRKVFYIYCCLFTFCYSWAAIPTRISTQDDFDSIVNLINSGIEQNIILTKGTYYLNKPIVAKNALSICGKKATITICTDSYHPLESVGTTNGHYIYKQKFKINPYSLFVTDNQEIIKVSESVDDSTLVNITSDAIIGSAKLKIGDGIKIPLTDNISNLRNRHLSSAYGYFDCGWSKIDFVVEHTDDKYLYCKALNTTNVPNINYEKTAYKNDIRYVIYNAELKQNAIYYDDNYLYVPKNIGTIRYVPCEVFNNGKPSITCFSDVNFNGISFTDFNGINISSPAKSECIIENCKFNNTLGTTLNIKKTNKESSIQALVRNCTFMNCSILHGTIINLSSEYINHPCIRVDGCIASRYPDNIVGYKNCGGAINVNADAEIIGNVVYNTCRDHLYFTKGCSVAKDNILYNTKEFNFRRERNLSNDWGAIYCNHFTFDAPTACDNKMNILLLESNYIHDIYAYADDARGIMIDDGRGDVTCRNNLILNAQCYSIDSREVKKFISTSSIRNVYENNILGSRYRLAGGQALSIKERPQRCNNIVLADYKTIINDNISTIKEDMCLQIVPKSVMPLYVSVNRKDYKKLSKLSNWSTIKRFVKK